MNKSPHKSVLVEFSRPHDGVTLIQLNRPEKRNALSGALLVELAEGLARAEEEGAICVVLTGSDTIFSAGADIAEMRQHGFDAISNTSRSEAWARIEAFGLPMIAAVRGPCLGGGHELAMLADIIVASEDATFGQPEIKIGIMPGDGATQRLTRQVGKSLAMKMMLTGESISASEALQVGLVAELTKPEECVPRALALARTIAARSPAALRLTKDAVLASYETFLHEGLRTERRNIAMAFTTADQKEGMAAFFEKRTPHFIGR